MPADATDMGLFHLPREIRDLIYKFMVREDETYLLACNKEQSLPDIIFSANPDLSILWTSETVQSEFLEVICAICTFNLILPVSELFLGAYFPAPVVESISPKDASRLQRIEIHMDLIFKSPQVLEILGSNNIDRKSCRILVKSQDRLSYNALLDLSLSEFFDELRQFKVVTMEQPIEPKSRWMSHRWSSELVLGPSREYFVGDRVYNEFHPCEFWALGELDRVATLRVHAERQIGLS